MKTNLKIIAITLATGVFSLTSASADVPKLERVATPNGVATYIYRPADQTTATVALYRGERGIGTVITQQNSVVKLKRLNLPNGGQTFIYRAVEEPARW